MNNWDEIRGSQDCSQIIAFEEFRSDPNLVALIEIMNL